VCVRTNPCQLQPSFVFDMNARDWVFSSGSVWFHSLEAGKDPGPAAREVPATLPMCSRRAKTYMNIRSANKIRAAVRKIITELKFLPYYISDIHASSRYPLPPVRLRYRVGADFDASTFLTKGERIAGDLLQGVADAGYEPSQFRSVLDFGCGCGRVMGPLREKMPQAAWHGADIDPMAIAWMSKNYQGVVLKQNPFHPPSLFGANQFDLIYGVSVFTHLDEAFQDEWLSELHRMSSAGGLLLLSIHGETVTPPDISALRAKGFLFQVTKTGFYKLDGLPDFYQLAWHLPEYIRSHWSRWFEVAGIRPRGINNHQDLVILRRK